MQDICGDGGLLKQVLREGTGESFPPNGAEVQVHYVGKLQDGTVFDSSRDRNQPFSFKLGQSSVIKGWDKGVATMRKGELSILRCAPNYAYGAEGSPPKIPPNSTLDFEVEVLDWDSYTKVVDGVKKCVLVEGEGYAKPTDRSSAIISYTICVDGANVFQSPVDYKFVIGSDLEVIEALDECVKSMKKGEKAHFLVKANLAFGETGSESLRVKPNTDVEIQIHLADFQKGRERWEMDTKEKFECAVQEKERGNALYKANKLDRSFRKYKAALDFVQYESNITEADVQKIADDLKYSCNSNIAAVKLKQKEYKEVVEYSKKALEARPDDVKVLFRRAQAYYAMGSTEDALKDIESGLLQNADDSQKKAFLSLKEKVQIQIRKIKQKEKQVYGGLFNRLKNSLFDDPEVGEKSKAKVSDGSSDSEEDLHAPKTKDSEGDVQMSA